MAPSGVEAIFFNYIEGHQYFKLWLPQSNKMVVTHQVQFYPQTFPLKSISSFKTTPVFLIELSDLEEPSHSSPATKDSDEPEEIGINQEDPQSEPVPHLPPQNPSPLLFPNSPVKRKAMSTSPMSTELSTTLAQP